ncbi:hypothetical protein JK636_19365 [Clostridium sp. YIM B02515]|uniref:RNA polymerase sigma-70 region 2 domain-containing protein n=1 Tax=Clostridium rhizosphaerae TaxID=2803861 RepID=A0ABS1TF54_9CLOT|nr:hypothetical protein [Clostridium rhizosphaerae]MBL4937871.1 hypothetical protein [Clostridium rhizosphaerae]
MMEAEEKTNIKLENEKDMETLSSSTWETLYHFVYFKVQNREKAGDITQETYIKAISYIKKNVFWYGLSGSYCIGYCTKCNRYYR